MTKKFAQYLTTLITNDVENKMPSDSMGISSYECEKVEAALMADKFDDVEKWVDGKTKGSSSKSKNMSKIQFDPKQRTFSAEGRQGKSFWQKHKGKIIGGTAAALALGGGAYLATRPSLNDIIFGKPEKISTKAKKCKEMASNVSESNMFAFIVGKLRSLVYFMEEAHRQKFDEELTAQVFSDVKEAISITKHRCQELGLMDKPCKFSGTDYTISSLLAEIERRVSALEN